MTILYYKDEVGFSEKKKQIQKLRATQRILVEQQKEHCIDVETFYELYINYDNEINELQKAIDCIQGKERDFECLESYIQKDIVNKYIKEVQIKFTGKKYSIALIRQ